MKPGLGTESRIGIMCATAKELAPYLFHMQDKKRDKYAMHSFYRGTIKGIHTILVYSGCGKVNAAIAAQILIDRYKVDAVIFSGIAGGKMERKIHFGFATTGDRYMEPIHPNAICIDMETAAVAHACYLNEIPFIAVRSISDNNNEAGQEAINRNYQKAVQQSYQFVSEMLEEIRYHKNNTLFFIH